MQHLTTLLSPSTLGLQSVTAHPLKVLDKTQIHITGGGKIDFYVVDGLQNDLILGIDALSKIDLPSRALFWFNQKWPFLGDKTNFRHH